eukprot:SAG31_NODE_4109_length_3573_cov_5.847726_4_plen_54_part_00
MRGTRTGPTKAMGMPGCRKVTMASAVGGKYASREQEQKLECVARKEQRWTILL